MAETKEAAPAEAAPAKEAPSFLRVHTRCEINRVNGQSRIYEPGDEVSSAEPDSREPWLAAHATRQAGEADPNKDSGLLRRLQYQLGMIATANMPLGEARTNPTGETTTETRDEAAEKAGAETAKQIIQVLKEIKQGHRDPPQATQPIVPPPAPAHPIAPPPTPAPTGKK